ncbi:ornithine cyclodeaminase family protein [Limosilactobacillus kribbianus]|uniref:ornithine cyclodeaminase family protein n=1 Tax=Limosilactobacillus kribbianus TaxID=2982695 RepID=UPI0022647080|nr:ornithine cyclodeaminase family protein [Limosilactobacillus kribbianus]
MAKFKILTKEQIQAVTDMGSIIEENKQVYAAKSNGETVVWPTTFYAFNPGKADMDIKSGYLPKLGIYGHKTVSFFGDNPAKGLPDLVGMIVVFSAQTGEPLGILDGSYITGIRTGAAGALGAKLLARPDSKKLLILGAGNQAAFQIAGTLTLFPQLKKVTVADVLHPENAQKFIATIAKRLQDEFQINASNVEFAASPDLASDVHDSDIIITVTPSMTPLIKKEWVKPGTHFSCIGADAEGKEEIDPQLFKDAKVFVDDFEHCITTGESEIPIKTGVITKEKIAGEIGDLLVGKATGRDNDQQITIFDAVGMALLDLAAAKKCLDLADQKALGTTAEL